MRLGTKFLVASRELYAVLMDCVVCSQGDFRNDSITSSKLISRWVSQQAGLDITIPAEVIKDSYSVIINTLWFKDTWVSKFAATNTQVLQMVE